LGTLSFVGLGLGPDGVSLEGVKVLKDADVAYVEYYTTPHEPRLLEVVQKAAGRQLVVVDRDFVEDGGKILAEATSGKVALAVLGDPMIATTHGELRVRAIRSGIRTAVVHGATIASAAASESGLHSYKFSRTVTVTREEVGRLAQAYRILHENLLDGSHTLLLLEHDVKSGEGVTPSEALHGLLLAEANFKRNVIGERTYVVVLSRLGRSDQKLHAGEIASLRDVEFGEPPHSIVIPGKLHFTEADSISALFSVGPGSVHGNTETVKRTAQTLVPRYIEKTKKALESVRATLEPKYGPVLENVELYLRDAEAHLTNGDDELAMLSVGYAEGLLDSLNFAGLAKIDW
jgi:diphthine synthase